MASNVPIFTTQYLILIIISKTAINFTLILSNTIIRNQRKIKCLINYFFFYDIPLLSNEQTTILY